MTYRPAMRADRVSPVRLAKKSGQCKVQPAAASSLARLSHTRTLFTLAETWLGWLQRRATILALNPQVAT